eukprot:TRINITY_DN1293_c7_g1_i1.p1 TRINITY_DN1293_c7_g1~~TRINITY_DN1293_c7_g1_i1.p1  ORF type:complete len:522 (+),score=200.32 TRINITY_DN1293_c7_g1_i1:80-1645(+)
MLSIADNCDAAIDTVLQGACRRAVADRAYLFRFLPGGAMSNTHEWCRDFTPACKPKFEKIPTGTFPWITGRISKNCDVVLSASDEVDAPREKEMMKEDGIDSLALVPVSSGSEVIGFVGFDACRPLKVWNSDDFSVLRRIGRVVHAITGLRDMLSAPQAAVRVTGLLRVPEWIREALRVPPVINVDTIPDALRKLPQLSCPLSRPVTAGRSAAMVKARSEFVDKRWTVVPPAVWGFDPAEKDAFVALCRRRWAEMLPDIAPYTTFRDVGYARYRYYAGDVQPLKHKPFFQVDPTANALLQRTPRPFNRIPRDIREHPMILEMLRGLLEGVWGGELGEEVHVNVHPVRVRNFHKGEVHKRLHATLEGTHIDSVERVAVVMIERHNVKAGMPKTALYSADCPIGKRRDDPEDEAIIGPKRVTEHMLREPLEAITFDDTQFKHDATDFLPETDGEKSWRCVMLVMARKPVQLPSPIDGRTIDGTTPRSECVEAPDLSDVMSPLTLAPGAAPAAPPPMGLPRSKF